MQLPFRTNKTWLTDDQLVLLDVVFDRTTAFRGLRSEVFRQAWNFGYWHNLDDDQLRRSLDSLCERGVLQIKKVNWSADDFFEMTVIGGALWSEERCPVWDRYCMDTYSWNVPSGKTLLTLVATSSEVRDEFLESFRFSNSARLRKFTIRNHELIKWRIFDQLYVGLAVYKERHQWTSEQFQFHRQQEALFGQKRIWWRGVSELQQFIRAAD